MNIKEPLRNRQPSPLLSPSAAVEAQMDALQMNDWPETDAGILAAFEFSKPRTCEFFEQNQSRCVRQWSGYEDFLGIQSFKEMMQNEPYKVLINCCGWCAKSDVVFTNKRGNKAVQAVKVRSQKLNEMNENQQQEYTFTFCMEKIEFGPWKDCWLTVGVRVGDYATV
eukprot:TRINITY_DN97619_c0_g1_i1.p2 TRINITY_DN97619_c0_g1~~TRINITY_DN97619_c0_g1_i1.p2  ORF type:complete len:167 (+),score=21.90 TRINITY_DN97619_c0_g1_i1:221-721(+)